MSKLFRVVAQGLLGILVGGALGALVGGLVALFTGRFPPDCLLLGAMMVGAMSAWMSILHEDWSVLTVISAGYLDWRPDEHQPDGKLTQQPAVSPVASAPTQRTVQEQRKTVILFLCTANSARSQIAEAYLKRYAGDRFEVHSAGLRPRGIHPLTVQVMKEVDIDISGQHSKPLLQFLGKLPVRVAISVCAPVEENCPTNWPGALASLSWPFEDPAVCGGTEDECVAKFRSVRDQIDLRIRSWLENT